MTLRYRTSAPTTDARGGDRIGNGRATVDPRSTLEPSAKLRCAGTPVSRLESAPPVVVGIDGSHTAIHAALWAVDEAVSRDTALRLVHVIDRPAAQDDSLEVQSAEAALRAADAAIQETHKPVKVETAIVRGKPQTALIEESRAAAMICVGSVGIGRLTRMLLGSTVADLARAAHCPVAIIRTDDASRSLSGCIAVAVEDSPGGAEVMRTALDEARLRNACVLAMGVEHWGVESNRRHLSAWRRRYPDVRVDMVTAYGGPANFLARDDRGIQLAVVGRGDGKRVEQLIGPVKGGLYPHADCSVLVVRG